MKMCLSWGAKWYVWTAVYEWANDKEQATLSRVLKITLCSQTVILNRLFPSARYPIQNVNQWIPSVTRKREKPRKMTLHFLLLWISPFTGKVMCVYPTAAPPGPHRILCLTAMPTQTHPGMTGLSRINSMQIAQSGQLRRTLSQAATSPPAAANLQRWPLDPLPGGLRGAPFRPQATSIFLLSKWQLKINEYTKTELLGFSTNSNESGFCFNVKDDSHGYWSMGLCTASKCLFSKPLFACVADQQRAVVSWVCNCTASSFNKSTLVYIYLYIYIMPLYTFPSYRIKPQIIRTVLKWGSFIAASSLLQKMEYEWNMNRTGHMLFAAVMYECFAQRCVS